MIYVYHLVIEHGYFTKSRQTIGTPRGILMCKKSTNNVNELALITISQSFLPDCVACLTLMVELILVACKVNNV